MSSTPKITALSSKQLNKTLSAKKKPLKTLKNILSSKSLDWPVLENPNALFEELLALGFNEIKEQATGRTKADIRKSTLFGVNQIGRCMNKGECSAVLFDADTPRMLISHLMQMALAKNIPNLLIPGLRNFLLDNLGFKCSAVSFKSGFDEHSKLLQIINLKGNNLQASEPASVIKKISTQHSSNEVAREEPSVAVYLKRPSDGQRAFNPPSKKLTDNARLKADTKTEYIKLDTESAKPIDRKKSLHSLYIKKVQNNPQRKAKK